MNFDAPFRNRTIAQRGSIEGEAERGAVARQVFCGKLYRDLLILVSRGITCLHRVSFALFSYYYLASEGAPSRYRDLLHRRC